MKRINPEFPPIGPDLKERTSTPDPEELAKHQQEYARMVKGQVKELLTKFS